MGPTGVELGRTHQHDLILDEGLRLDLGRCRETADHPELGAMGAQRVHRLRRRPGHDAHAHVGMCTLERYDDLRQEVRGGDARRDDRQRTDDPLTELADASDGLGQKRLARST